MFTYTYPHFLHILVVLNHICMTNIRALKLQLLKYKTFTMIRTTISIQFNRIGTENTREMNIPLLSKYCCLENVLKNNEWVKLKKKQKCWKNWNNCCICDIVIKLHLPWSRFPHTTEKCQTFVAFCPCASSLSCIFIDLLLIDLIVAKVNKHQTEGMT